MRFSAIEKIARKESETEIVLNLGKFEARCSYKFDLIKKCVYNIVFEETFILLLLVRPRFTFIL